MTNRFTEHPHVTPEEAGTVVDEAGQELKAGDAGFLEALAESSGFKYEDLSQPAD